MSKKNIAIILMVLCAIGALLNFYVAVMLDSWFSIAMGLILIVCYAVNMQAYNQAERER